MTSDAKVGLLLGLFFIFVIAFIINGLPRFRSDTNNNELTTMANSPNDSYIGSNERKAREAFRRETPVQTKTKNIAKAQETTRDEGNVRYKRPLSQDTNVVTEQPTTVATTEEKAKSTTPTHQTNKEIKVNMPRPVKPDLPKVYTVQNGDNLAKIAQKFYGSERGNKTINVNRIFEANRRVLKTADDIQVGQKLVIPLLKDETEGASSGGLLERIISIGKTQSPTKIPNKPQSKPSVPKNTKYYVVKDGDSLWKIADRQLGNKERFREIIKLNALDDEDYLKIGQRLIIPVQ
jgi:nucleoid-associated protein YgaU